MTAQSDGAPVYPDAPEQPVPTPGRTAGISPKAIAAAAMAVLAYLTTQQLVDFPAWADLLITVASVAGAAYLASPGDVLPAKTDTP